MAKTFTDYAEAFAIFAKHKPDEKWVLCAEHDIIYAHIAPEDITDEADKARLEELGWFIENDNEAYAVNT